MREAGYAPSTATKPSVLTESLAWKELVRYYLPDENLAQKHSRLLNARKIEHMTFPLGPQGDEHPFLSGGGNKSDVDEPEDEESEHQERTSLTDQEIVEMLAENDCTVKRIVHGNTARHVYFWAADYKALEKGLDMAYKLKGVYTAPAEVPTGPTVNIFYNPQIQTATKSFEDSLKAMIAGLPPPTNEATNQPTETSLGTE